MPAPKSHADTYLLNEHGQPSTAAIDAEVELQLRQFRGEAAALHEQRRTQKRHVIVAMAAQQAERFGKSADDARRLDIANSLSALDYAGHLTRDERSLKRHALRSEDANLRRAQIAEALRPARLDLTQLLNKGTLPEQDHETVLASLSRIVRAERIAEGEFA